MQFPSFRIDHFNDINSIFRIKKIMAVQHFSRSAHPHLPPFVRFAIIAAAGIAAAGSINVQARDLTAAVNSNFSTLDTWDAIDNLSRAVSSSIYEGLYRFDTNLTPQPQLAESYTVSDDGLVYTFKLRPNVKLSGRLGLHRRNGQDEL